MSTNHSTNEPNQSTTSTKKSILIKPDNDTDLQDLINLKLGAGKKFRESLERLAQKYDFTYNDYKRNRIKIDLDFSAFAALQTQQDNKQ
jgi:predicted transcriptional regulator